MKKTIGSFILSSFALLVFSINSFSVPIVRSAAGADAADILATVNEFRDDLGILRPNVVGSFPDGRREINWDAVPDTRSSPNALPANFFNVNSPRGVVFSTPCSNAAFFVSADSSNPTNTPLRFGEIDPSYTNTFETFSAERLFTVRGFDSPCNVMVIDFFVPGTSIPAETAGFGAVFTDVDIPGHTRIIAYDRDGHVLGRGVLTVPKADDGLSFIGVSYSEPKIARVVIISGKNGLFPGIIDSFRGNDVVAMDDFIYGEPQPIN